MRYLNRICLTACINLASSFVGCSDDRPIHADPDPATAGQASSVAGASGVVPDAAGNLAPAPSAAGMNAGSAGALASSGSGGSSGNAGAGMGGSTAPSAAGSSGSAAGSSGAAGSGGMPMTMTMSAPRDYGARGPFEVLVEKNVGETFRNTNLTDDSARCASLVGGLGDDADSGSWAIYPEDMDRQLYTLFRPATLEEGVKYPVITWGNGTCSQPLLFEPLLGHLASHGFVVIATNWRWVAGGVEMKRALEYVLSENENPESALYGKLAADRIGASGHSQGSSATVTVGADARIVATVPIQGASAAGVRALKGPTFLIAGERDMAVSPASVESAFRSATVPAVYGLALGIDHVVPVMMPQPILKAVTAWFRIHLADDQAARGIFYDSCELCSDPGWEVETANL